MAYFLMIYQGFKPEVIYWEFVNTARKIAILFCLLFDLKVAISLSIIILIGTARIQIKLKPYKDRENNKIEFLSAMGGVSVIVGALVYSRPQQHDVLNAIVFTSVIVINSKFLLEWLFRILLVCREISKFVEILACCLGKIMWKKCPELEPQNNLHKEDRSQKSTKKEKHSKEFSPALPKKKVHKKPKRGKRKKRRPKKDKSHQYPKSPRALRPFDDRGD